MCAGPSSYLGSEKTADEFDHLSPDESKRRLAALARKMDKNSDGFVTEEELTDWVHKSLLSLDEEETNERFDEIDESRRSNIERLQLAF